MIIEDWLSRMKAAIQLGKSDPAQAVADLSTLLSDTESAERLGITSWHVGQNLSLLASIEEERGRLEASAEYDVRLATRALQESQGNLASAGYSLASAALKNFELGQTEVAARLATQALECLGRTTDPSPVYERLIAELRKHRSRTTGDGNSLAPHC